MQEFTQYSEDYDTCNHTTDNDNVINSLDSGSLAVVYLVIKLTSLTDVSTPVLLSKIHYQFLFQKRFAFSPRASAKTQCRAVSFADLPHSICSQTATKSSK